MRADAARREPERLAAWESTDLYGQIIRATADKPSFILHDGPPYANGHIHMGHALNKILKDVVVRSRTMMGALRPLRAGVGTATACRSSTRWTASWGATKSGMTDLQIRAACREYATRFVDIQREEFRRLGVLGTWNDPYLTMSNRYEADTAAAFGKVVEQGLLYRERKSIRWCWHCRTALAEAELEYQTRRDPEITGGAARRRPGRGAPGVRRRR
ncbi:MAG: class I tRNA ligase family protein [Thermoanaerobaculaceae bacterium]